MSQYACFTSISNRWSTLVESVIPLPTVYSNSSDLEEADRKSAWAKLNILPGESARADFGCPNARYRYPGVVIAELYAPLREGDGALLEICDEVMDVFRNKIFDGNKFFTPYLTIVGRETKFYKININFPFYYEDLA